MKLTMLRLITALLVFLFFYTAIAKLTDLGTFERELLNQTVPRWSVPLLLWLIPSAELLSVGLLLSPPVRILGLYLSACMMLVFTTYMGLVLLKIFERVPCSCGGVLKSMGFGFHFIFNMFFFLLSLTGIWLMRSMRRRQHPD
ncbi:MauE/DoxX family redox-associated membrane protein [Dyadobacter subterraneus]|uniref:MauE/DoxX family redox-associated membrane protein n=1 Tax=Dyadobacter subterraneus TaxID=2773304 RepID=UPI0034D9716A